MRERRQYYRIRTIARVHMLELAEDDVEDARLRVRARVRGLGKPLSVSDDVITSAEQHANQVLLQQILFGIDRLNRRVDALAELAASGATVSSAHQPPRTISLSGSGFSGHFPGEFVAGRLVEAELDLWETGLPLVACVARVIHVQKNGKNSSVALNFEELLPEDRERIVQLAIRSQSLELRDSQEGTP